MSSSTDFPGQPRGRGDTITTGPAIPSYPLTELRIRYEGLRGELAEAKAALRDVLDWAVVMPGFHQNAAVQAAQAVLGREET